MIFEAQLICVEGYEPAVIEHCILASGLDLKMKASEVGKFQQLGAL